VPDRVSDTESTTALATIHVAQLEQTPRLTINLTDRRVDSPVRLYNTTSRKDPLDPLKRRLQSFLLQNLHEFERIKKPQQQYAMIGQLLCIIYWVSKRIYQGYDLNVDYNSLESYFSEWETVTTYVKQINFTDSKILCRQLPFAPQVS